MKGIIKTDRCFSFIINGVELGNFRLESSWEDCFEKYVSDRGWVIVYNPDSGNLFADMFSDIFESDKEEEIAILAASHDLLRKTQGGLT